MTANGVEDLTMLSDNELLDSIEKLLRAPGFVDLCLGYDSETGCFYAGCEAGKGIRDVLRRVLLENRPAGTSLAELTSHTRSPNSPEKTVLVPSVPQ